MNVDNLRQAIAANIRMARQQCGFTQEELSWRAGVSVTAISQYENAKREPKYSTLMMLAEALGFPVAYLVRD